MTHRERAEATYMEYRDSVMKGQKKDWIRLLIRDYKDVAKIAIAEYKAKQKENKKNG